VASVFDQDYTPYTTPTTAASFATNQAADGINEATPVNIQGVLTTTGVTIRIPYTATGSVSLPAFTRTVTIPATSTEDGISRDVTFSYSAISLGAGSGNIIATLRSVGGTLNAKKLDVQTGLGNDNLGVLLAQFTYATNNTSGTADFQFRNLSGIPDRNIADANHRMLYIPITGEDGNIWLNNNLGADYSNTAKASFNPMQQATAFNDWRAYGYSFQWGRFSDGHDVMNWTATSTGTRVNGTTTTQSTTNTPANSQFISNASDWRNPQNDNLWQGVGGINNPCPTGYRLPTTTELNTLRTAAAITTYIGAINSVLKLPTSNGASGAYWASTVSGANASYLGFNSGNGATGTDVRATGSSVRCIRDNTAAATIAALNCGSAVQTGTLGNGSAASGVSIAVPYTGGNSGVQYGQVVTSTGVTGLTATLASSNIAGSGNLTYTISGTPSSGGTASFALSVGGASCTMTATIGAAPVAPIGAGTLSGKSCFDIALGNNNTTGCGPLTSRASQQANFTQTATNTQTYTFTPSGTVSNVRFMFVNTNGTAITSLTGGNAGNNITTAQSATVTYANTLNTAAAGLTSSNAIKSEIYVIYNNGATNNGTDQQLKLTANIKDCACCGAMISATVFKEFLCHNLGANTALDPSTFVVGNADGSGGTQGYLYQWGRQSDGHELRNSATQAGPVAAPVANTFITVIPSPYDWLTPQNSSLWIDASKTVNDPCPAGFKVPSQAQFGGLFRGGMVSGLASTATNNTWTYTGNGYMVGANLYLPGCGFREYSSGTLASQGIGGGKYWSSTQFNNSNAYSLDFDSGTITPGAQYFRARGYSIRCIAE
jgi:uncharacterized protein (TIGR02145 family)